MYILFYNNLTSNRNDNIQIILNNSTIIYFIVNTFPFILQQFIKHTPKLINHPANNSRIPNAYFATETVQQNLFRSPERGRLGPSRTITRAQFANLRESFNNTESEHSEQAQGEDKLERFANTSEGRREMMGSRFSTRGNTGSGPGFEHCSRMQIVVYTESPDPYSLMQPRGRQPASRCQPSTIIPSWKPRRNACVAVSRGPIPPSRRSPLPPRYLDEPRRIRIPSW